MMLTISWLMTLVALVIIPLSLVVVSLDRQASQSYFKQQQDYLGHVNGHVEEMYAGHIVMGPSTARSKHREVRQAQRRCSTARPGSRSSSPGMMMPIMSFIGNLGYVAVCILGGYLAVRRPSGGRHPGLHPVRALLHPAARADGQHLQRPAADRRGGRARFRVPGRSGGGPRDAQTR